MNPWAHAASFAAPAACNSRPGRPRPPRRNRRSDASRPDEGKSAGRTSVPASGGGHGRADRIAVRRAQRRNPGNRVHIIAGEIDHALPARRCTVAVARAELVARGRVLRHGEAAVSVIAVGLAATRRALVSRLGDPATRRTHQIGLIEIARLARRATARREDVTGLHRAVVARVGVGCIDVRLRVGWRLVMARLACQVRDDSDGNSEPCHGSDARSFDRQKGTRSTSGRCSGGDSHREAYDAIGDRPIERPRGRVALRALSARRPASRRNGPARGRPSSTSATRPRARGTSSRPRHGERELM